MHTTRSLRPNDSGSDVQSREELLARGLLLVRRLAHRMTRRLPATVQKDDLVSSGHEGLLRALEAFDPSRGDCFESYAGRRIQGAMLDELRSADHVTHHGRRRSALFARASRTLDRELGRPARPSEIAASAGVSLESYRRHLADLANAPTLAGPHDRTAEEMPDTGDDPGAHLAALETRSQLARAIEQLPPRWAEVISLYYRHELRQAEIGRLLGITESRVCQILSRAHGSLRAQLEQAGVEASDVLA